MKFYKIITIFSLFIVSSLAQDFDKFTLMSEQYPPYNMIQNDKPTGISIDLMKIILKKMDSKQTIKDVQFLPWARSYNIIQSKKNTMLFVMARTQKRENLFKWAGPVGSSKIALISRKDKNIKINSISDMKQYRIGSVKNDVAELALKEIGIVKTDSISGINAIEKSIKKLDNGRIDLFAYMFEPASWGLKEFNPNNYENVYTLKQNDFYFAFHKDTDDAIVQKIQKILDELKADGTLKKIKSEYGR